MCVCVCAAYPTIQTRRYPSVSVYTTTLLLKGQNRSAELIKLQLLPFFLYFETRACLWRIYTNRGKNGNNGYNAYLELIISAQSMSGEQKTLRISNSIFPFQCDKSSILI